jgi:hypothetical protein
MTLKNLFIVVLLFVFISACQDNDPKKEDVPEMITKVTLTFTADGQQVVVTATDPDGDGVQNIQMDGPINLKKSTGYLMTIGLINGLAQPGDAAYNVSAEVKTEGDEHMFFFSWNNDAFTNPAGNGNIDSRNDAINYSGGDDSKDVNGLPLGLTTTWTTTDVAVSGSSFRVLLKHQPGLKSATSSSSDGETDLDLAFTLNVQ